MATVEGLGEGSPQPIVPERQLPPGRAPWVFRAPAGEGPDLVADLERRYPVFAEDDVRIVIEDDPEQPGWVRGGIFVTLDGRMLEEIAETYLGSTVYIRPAIGEASPPSILMTWWAVLFALSHLARYEPATWTRAISPDRSALTVPIEAGLRHAGRILPRLVLHALTDEWST
jgi:hypothetical protein